MSKSPLLYVHQMLDYCQDIDRHIQGLNEASFSTNRTAQHAVMHCLAAIGEAVARIPEEFREQYPDVPWQKVKDTRNFMVHQYDKIDVEILWDIAENHIPALVVKLEAMV